MEKSSLLSGKPGKSGNFKIDFLWQPWLVPVKSYMKYLGLTLDSDWSFTAHFEQLAPRMEKVANALSRLLPNIGGPDGRVRRLFANVVQSIALYAVPIWAVEMEATPYIQMLMHRAHKRVAQRVIRARWLMMEEWSRWLTNQTVNPRTQRVVAAPAPPGRLG